jgi:CubicO group peptidase (beta-lactamase class C family)
VQERDSDTVARLEIEVEAMEPHRFVSAAAGGFSGTVLLARNGERIFTGAYGWADRARSTPNTVDARFRNGSMNKMFTAVAVLQLAQDGQLSLDDPIGRYLTNYPNEALGSAVTIHHLLTHTGGTGDIFGPEFGANTSRRVCTPPVPSPRTLPCRTVRSATCDRQAGSCRTRTPYHSGAWPPAARRA